MAGVTSIHLFFCLKKIQSISKHVGYRAELVIINKGYLGGSSECFRLQERVDLNNVER
jgi:hypothetical protein